MTDRKLASLAQLHRLAALKRDIELARLAEISGARARLQSAIRALDDADQAPLDGLATSDGFPMTDSPAVTEPPAATRAEAQPEGADRPPDADDASTRTARAASAAAPAGNAAVIAAHLRYRRWADAQRGLLNQRLARVSADWLEKRPDAARAVGRAAVLDRLTALQKTHSRKKE